MGQKRLGNLLDGWILNSTGMRSSARVFAFWVATGCSGNCKVQCLIRVHWQKNDVSVHWKKVLSEHSQLSSAMSSMHGEYSGVHWQKILLKCCGMSTMQFVLELLSHLLPLVKK
jgi:hypothetical protein